MCDLCRENYFISLSLAVQYNIMTTSSSTFNNIIMMLCSIFFFIAIIDCMAFTPPQIQPSSSFQRAAVVQISEKGTQHVLLCDVTRGISSVLSRMRSRKQTTILSASSDTNSNNAYQNEKYSTRRNLDEVDLRSATSSVGEYNPEQKLGLEREAANVGDPQTAQMEPLNITKVLTELQAIQSQGPKKCQYAIYLLFLLDRLRTKTYTTSF